VRKKISEITDAMKSGVVRDQGLIVQVFDAAMERFLYGHKIQLD
jgi:hypothetical protein